MRNHLGRGPRLAASAVAMAVAALLLATSTATAGVRSRVYFHGPRAEHVVALTFDDGWAPSNCAKVDRILQANGVAATFFPSARWVRRAPSLWKELATRYPFGDHTTNHPHMKGLSYARQYDEIATDREIVERITGVPLIPVFRAPYGELDATTLEAAAAAGFPVTMEWDVNVYDLTGASDKELLAQATAGGNGSVITMHCGADPTVRILPAVIEHYRTHGFRFVTVPELLAGVAAATTASPEPSTVTAAPAPSVMAAGGAMGPPPGPRATTNEIDPRSIRAILFLVLVTIAGLVAFLIVVAHRQASVPRRPTSGLRTSARM